MCLIFLVPASNYMVYSGLAVLYFISNKSTFTRYTFLLILPVTYGIVLTLLAELMYGGGQGVKDMFRLMVIGMIILSRPSFSSSFFYKLIVFYSFIQLGFVLGQWIDPYATFHKYMVGWVYNEGHYLGSIRLRFPRASGIQSNIIESAFISFLLGLLYLDRLILNKSGYIWSVLGLVLSILTIFLSQSKSIIGVTIVLLIYSLWRYNKKILMSCFVLFLVYYSDVRSQLSELDQFARLSKGIGISSFQFRINLWRDLIHLTFFSGNLIWLLFGIGSANAKSLLAGSTLDSDIFYSIQLFGLSSLVVVLPISISLIIRAKNVLPNHLFPFLIGATPLFFVLDIFWNIKILTIVILFLTYFYEENRIYSSPL